MITNISFNNRPQVSFGVIVGPDPSNQYNKNNDNSGDTFEKSEPKKAEPQKTEPKTKAKAKSSYSPWQKGTALLGAFGLGGCVGAGAVGAYAYNVIGEQNAPSAYVIPGKIASAEDVEILAEYAGSSSDIVYDYNDADGIEQLSKKENVYIPYGYTGLEEKMAKLKDALASDGLDYQERLIAEEKVEAIQKFEQQQKEYVLAVAHQMSPLTEFNIDKNKTIYILLTGDMVIPQTDDYLQLRTEKSLLEQDKKDNI